MDGFAKDQKLVKDLVAWSGKAASRIALDLGMAATTLTRPAKGTADTRLGRKTIETLREAYPDFPGWNDADESEPNPRAPATLQELASEHGIVFVEEVDLALGMGATYLNGEPEVLGLVPFREEWLRDVAAGAIDRLKVVRGRGDSMQPTILDGDIVLVDTGHRRIDDQDRIWALAYGDLGVIRRVRVTPKGTWLLMPDNQVVRPDEITDGEAAVIGRVIWIGRRI